MRVYLDLCAIQRPFDDAGQRRIREEAEALYRILELIRQGRLDLVGSFALEFESEASMDPIKRGFTESVLDLAVTGGSFAIRCTERFEMPVCAAMSFVERPDCTRACTACLSIIRIILPRLAGGGQQPCTERRKRLGQ